ncbi:MAG: hypothetical protein P8X98_06610 [Woeseiaceae bacterium]
MTAEENERDRRNRSLAELQDAFSTAYRRRKEGTIQELRRGDPPVIVRLSEEAMLLIGPAGPERFDLDTADYNILKQLSHIAPLVAMLATDESETCADRALIDEALESLHDSGVDGVAAVIVDGTRELLRKIDTEKQKRAEHVARYRECVRPALEQIARNAATAELDVLARAMRQVEARIGKDGLERAFLVICGGHQARRGEMTKQFFRHWLAARLEDSRPDPHRILYAEHRGSIDEVLDLVATRIVDEVIADFLFDDPTQLDEDIMGEAARELLESASSVLEFGR